MKQKKSGFTLIELMIVIAITGILTSITITLVKEYRDKRIGGNKQEKQSITQTEKKKEDPVEKIYRVK